MDETGKKARSDRVKNYQAEYRRKNRDIIYRKHRNVRMLSKMRARSRRTGRELALSLEDVHALMASQTCSVSGLSIDNSCLGGPWCASIDRVDSSIGYTLDNTRTVCLCVNIAMNKWGTDVLIDMSRAVTARFNEGSLKYSSGYLSRIDDADCSDAVNEREQEPAKESSNE